MACQLLLCWMVVGTATLLPVSQLLKRGKGREQTLARNAQDNTHNAAGH
jgi:hypothetical protein